MDLIFLGINDAGMRIYNWLCECEGIDVIALLTNPDQFQLIQQTEPDLLVSAGFDHLVPSKILEIPDKGALNIHPSLLPHNRGKNPNVWSLVEGTPAGATVHYMDEQYDTGPIIAQREVNKNFPDDGKDLHKRLEDAQFDLFKDCWPDIVADNIEPKSQEKESGKYYSTEDFLKLCELDPNEKVRIKPFLDQLRALTFPPYDNARIEVDGETYYVEVDIRRATD